MQGQKKLEREDKAEVSHFFSMAIGSHYGVKRQEESFAAESQVKFLMTNPEVALKVVRRRVAWLVSHSKH